MWLTRSAADALAQVVFIHVHTPTESRGRVWLGVRANTPTPLHHCCKKKVPIPFHEFNLDAIEKNYSQDPPLSIHLKSLCLRALSVCNVIFQEYDSEQLPSTPNPKWRKGVWQKGNWCGSTTLYLIRFNVRTNRKYSKIRCNVLFSRCRKKNQKNKVSGGAHSKNCGARINPFSKSCKRYHSCLPRHAARR